MRFQVAGESAAEYKPAKLHNEQALLPGYQIPWENLQFKHKPEQVDLIADHQNISGTKDPQQVLYAKGPEKLSPRCGNQDYYRNRRDTNFDGHKPVHTMVQYRCHDGICFSCASIE